MSKEKEFEEKFWKALESDRTMMLGLAGIGDGHTRPMTAQLDPDRPEGGRGPIWFFTAKETALVKQLQPGSRAIATFADKGHNLFAAVHGSLTLDNDRAMIDRLWNRFVAPWFEGGKDDPKLALLRFDAERAEIWIDASSAVAAVKLLLGVDPKEDYKEKVREVRLN
jgi:general stress protein 26